MSAAYLEAYSNGRLQQAAHELSGAMRACTLCPRECGVDRLKGEKGFCATGALPVVYSYLAHHGEEPPISGEKGSGTIFFSHCNLACVYCQNFAFSQLGEGQEVSVEVLAGIMLELQEAGCHNINLVTPTHVLGAILEALIIAVSRGLRIPLVYNSGGYERPEIIRLLNGIVDIYLPDMRYGTEESARKYSGVPHYPRYNQAAVKVMFEQVGLTECDEQGIMRRGMIIRHLVLPNGLSGTEAIMKFIAREVSKEAYISLMSQYHPYHKSSQYNELNRGISEKEYAEAQALMDSYGLHNGWSQESGGMEKLAGVHIKPMLHRNNGTHTRGSS